MDVPRPMRVDITVTVDYNGAQKDYVDWVVKRNFGRGDRIIVGQWATVNGMTGQVSKVEVVE